MSDEEAIRKGDEIIRRFKRKALTVIAAWTKVAFMLRGGEAIEVWLLNLEAHRLNSFAIAAFHERLLLWQQGALGSSFRRWRSEAESQEAQRTALTALKRMVHRQFFAAWLKWWEYFQSGLAKRFGMQDAVKKWLLGSLARALTKWIEVNANTAREDLQELAVMRLRHIREGRAWCTWVEASRDGKERRALLARAVGCLLYRELARAYRNWAAAHQDGKDTAASIQRVARGLLLRKLGCGWRS